MRCSVKDLLKNDGEITEVGGTLEYEVLENNEPEQEKMNRPNVARSGR